ncbi:MAG: M1 family peptidase [Chitinophagaceae bacterium]|nr:MAG: M1 family peptidase [Chitinophagaceae bacterium]
MFKRFFFLVLSVLPALARAQDIDVLHYNFNLRLSDRNDTVKGLALINFETVKPRASVSFDLAGLRKDGKGMVVKSVVGADVEGWFQRDDKVEILFELASIARTSKLVRIEYAGIPADGLIISKNKFGDRTFFADNWPNRAHHWLPCNDRPDDKASFEFYVHVPQRYQVISNGTTENPSGAPWRMVDVAQRTDTLLGRIYHWKEDIPSPTKVMVIGAANFAVKKFPDSTAGVPVTAWVYPQDSTKGFYDYALAPSILKFFSDYIAPFPYKKLANVQSKTIFGGMENASAIFYAEESVTGDRKWEDVFAHEIAHQWFGDMATEKSFAHLWLSEGFATYMTNIYIERKYGVDSMRIRLYNDRQQVMSFKQAGYTPVVDTTTNLMSLLNPNSYQKGGWVLHMLRRELGDTAFQKTIQAYYARYRGKNADTRDLQAVAESVSGKKLDWFFDQWLYQPGMPSLSFTEKYRADSVTITIKQNQARPYRVPVEVGLVGKDGTMDLFSIRISKAVTTVSLPTGGREVEVHYDPDVNLLFRNYNAPRSGNYFRVKQKRATGEQIRLN